GIEFDGALELFNARFGVVLFEEELFPLAHGVFDLGHRTTLAAFRRGCGRGPGWRGLRRARGMAGALLGETDRACEPRHEKERKKKNGFAPSCDRLGSPSQNLTTAEPRGYG